MFRAGDVARKTQVTVIDRQGVSAAAALERMEHFDREVAIILGRDKTYHGMVSRSSLIATSRDGGADPYRRAFLPDIEPIPGSESLSNVLGRVAASAVPLPSSTRPIVISARSASPCCLKRSIAPPEPDPSEICHDI